MKMALALAQKGKGFTNPNPVVGAVIVKNGRIVGRGYHKKCGMPHAEVNALKDAGPLAKGATIYVTLEPCDHFGRTPPCTEAVIRSGIKKVVLAMKDPNPVNNGKGVKRLNFHGIDTVVGVMEEEARGLNRPYIKYITSGRPYITLKLAESLDGKIATRTGESKWITGEDSRRYGRLLRCRVDAVMVGANTVLRDDPLLLCDRPVRRQPARVIVDSRLKISPHSKVFTKMGSSPVIIAAGSGAPAHKAKVFESMGVKVLRIKLKDGVVDLDGLMKALATLNIMDVLVEGGGELAASLIRYKLVDRFLFFIAPRIIGGRDAVPSVGGVGAGRLSEAVELKNVTLNRFKKDILVMAEAG